MTQRTKDELLELLLRTLPFPEQMKKIDTTTNGVAWIAFDWRGDRYRISTDLRVEQLDDALVESNKTTLLMEKLLKLSASAEAPV
jgi:hypothetical protein